MKQNSNFTEGSIARPLIKFALPVLFAMCLKSLYGAVDLLVVGQFGTAADVSAVATGSQMMQMVTVIITGLAMGTTILLGQTMGSKQKDEAGNIMGSSICFLFCSHWELRRFPCQNTGIILCTLFYIYASLIAAE